MVKRRTEVLHLASPTTVLPALLHPLPQWLKGPSAVEPHGNSISIDIRYPVQVNDIKKKG